MSLHLLIILLWDFLENKALSQLTKQKNMIGRGA